MLNIKDNRNTGECQLKDLDINSYFEYDGVLCRRVHWTTDLEIAPKDDDTYVIYLVGIGQIMPLNRNAVVKPIADRQICLELGD